MSVFGNLLHVRMKNSLLHLKITLSSNQGKTECKFRTFIMTLRIDNTVANVSE